MRWGSDGLQGRKMTWEDRKVTPVMDRAPSSRAWPLPRDAPSCKIWTTELTGRAGEFCS